MRRANRRATSLNTSGEDAEDHLITPEERLRVAMGRQ
jgi:hypothetical protein